MSNPMTAAESLGRSVDALIAERDALVDALVLALPYVTDAESFPEHFKPGVVAADLRKMRAALVPCLERDAANAEAGSHD